MDRVEEIREKTINTRKIKEMCTGEITQQILDIEYLLENLDMWEATAHYWKKNHGNASSELLQKTQELEQYKKAEEQGRLVMLPCKVGDTVYRICPKCNDKHDGSCQNCAWLGTGGIYGCDVYGLWSNGEYPPDKCTIVPREVTWNYYANMKGRLGKTVFLTCEEAESALKGGGGDE